MTETTAVTATTETLRERAERAWVHQEQQHNEGVAKRRQEARDHALHLICRNLKERLGVECAEADVEIEALSEVASWDVIPRTFATIDGVRFVSWDRKQFADDWDHERLGIVAECAHCGAEVVHEIQNRYPHEALPELGAMLKNLSRVPASDAPGEHRWLSPHHDCPQPEEEPGKEPPATPPAPPLWDRLSLKETHEHLEHANGTMDNGAYAIALAILCLAQQVEALGEKLGDLLPTAGQGF